MNCSENCCGQGNVVDFFSESACTEKPIKVVEFGLCDISDSHKPAFSTVSTEEPWIACVKNPSMKHIQIVGIDHNIYFSEILNRSQKKCDVFLYCKDNPCDFVIFVELKTGGNTTKWVHKAKEQLLNTVQKFADCHKDILNTIVVRQAYAANSIDNTTVIPRQNDIEDFFELGFDFYVKSIIRV